MGEQREKATVEGALVEAELFIKYRMPMQAVTRLQEVVQIFPYNADLRLRLAEYLSALEKPHLAAEQLIALADIYLQSHQTDLAQSALSHARSLYPDAPQLSHRFSLLQQQHIQPIVYETTEHSTLAGDLHYISLFDVIQVLEKNVITGIISVHSQDYSGNLYFNQGLLVDAVLGQYRGKIAFKMFAEISDGNFQLEKSPVEFQVAIVTESNAQLILDCFSEDEESPSF